MEKPKKVVVAYFLDCAATVWDRYLRKALADKGIDLIVIIPSEPWKEALKKLRETVECERTAGRDVFCIVDIGLCELTPAANKVAAEIFDSGVSVTRYSVDLDRDGPFTIMEMQEFFAQPELRRDWAYVFTCDDTPTDIADAIADWYDKQAVTAQP